MTCWILFKRNNNVIGMPPEETALVSGQFECGLSESTLIEDYLLTYATGWFVGYSPPERVVERTTCVLGCGEVLSYGMWERIERMRVGVDLIVIKVIVACDHKSQSHATYSHTSFELIE